MSCSKTIGDNVHLRKQITQLSNRVVELEAELNKIKPTDDIIDKLLNLQRQATTERSHYYVAACITEAIQEITSLRIATK